jgi:hypothetical protein
VTREEEEEEEEEDESVFSCAFVSGLNVLHVLALHI